MVAVVKVIKKKKAVPEVAKYKASYIQLKKMARTFGATGRFWIKGCEAKDSTGRSVGVSDPLAEKFCLLGAYRWNGNKNPLTLALLKDAIKKHNNGKYWGIPYFNDASSTKWKDVHAVLTLSLAAARTGAKL